MNTKAGAMQRLFILILGLACSTTVNAALNVFACEPEWAALAKRIGGEHVKVSSATTASQDVHFIQARPGLIAKLRKADLLLCTGAGLEAGWLPILQRRARNPAVLTGRDGYMDLSEQVDLLDQSGHVDRAHGDVHPEGNPHYHLDPRSFIPVSRAIADRFAKLDPAYADEYRTAATVFEQKWQKKIAQWEVSADNLLGKRIVVHHIDWNYLASWLGVQIVGTLEPKPGVPPSSTHLSALLSQVKMQSAGCVIRTNYQAARASDWLAKRAGIKAASLPYTVGADLASQTLEDWFDELLRRLLEACQ